MAEKNFTFLIPNTSWFGKRYWHNFPTTEGLMIAILKQHGIDANIIDANIENLSESQLEERIRNLNPKIVGIGGMALEYKDCLHKSFEIVKRMNPGIITIVGGIYPTLSPEIVTKDRNIDYFVFGEGEERLPLLLRALYDGDLSKLGQVDGLAFREQGEIVINPLDKTKVADLEHLPLPDYSKFDMPKYMNYQQKFTQQFRSKQLPVALMMTSRGCAFKCTFCSSKELYSQKVRTMSPKRVLEEIDMLIDKYGARELTFVDDNLLWPKDRAIEIMDGLIERKKQGKDIVWKSANLAIYHMEEDVILDKMKESGCYRVIVSIESGCANTLKRMRKPINLGRATQTLEKIQKRGFDDVSSNFVIGMPGDTWEDIREHFDWVNKTVDRGLLDYVIFHIATPFPKTELYDICKKENYLPKNFSFERPDYYGFGKGVITTPDFTPPELQILRAYEWDRINFKTPEKRAKIANMVGINLDELETWRTETRRVIGLHVKSADKRGNN